ncbi:hypothetical protein B0J11DRAFT_119324 [Dendryphion nanum]|uniref:Glycosyltransferase family 31 protein n=1 Tax=Dendryphion nanum TaxID=256645 RepID=A0A9P9DBN2_9PLEO|nr:hypothetical protein B0J11DRAFT_119324 [Dendryphion nanum]
MMPSRTGRFRLAPRLIGFAAALYAIIWVSGFPRHYDDEELHRDPPPDKPAGLKLPYPLEFDHIIVSVKTTAVDAYDLLPPLLLLTEQKYYDSMILMSDLRMDLGAFHIEDVLDRYTMEFISSQPQLERYAQQLHYYRYKIDIDPLREDNHAREREVQSNLDKYKMLRMLHRAWELRPERKWYVFAQADAYLNRNNLEAWLGQYDSSEPTMFANSPDPSLPEPSALGGTTFVVSVQVMRNLFKDRENNLNQWNQKIQDFPSSFETLHTALTTEISVDLNSTWPGLSGFHPATVPYGAGMWCEPVIALHSVSPQARSDIWRFEHDRTELHHVRDPLTFADLWGRFLQAEDMAHYRENWDNLSSGPDNAKWNILFEGVQYSTHAQHHLHHHTIRDTKGNAPAGENSWESCQEACNNHEHCMQWSYSSSATPNWNENGKTRCHLSRSMRLGEYKGPIEIEREGEETQKIEWKSGWRKDRFEAWARNQRCKGQQNKKN